MVNRYSTLRSFNTFAPGVLSEITIQNSNTRIGQRWMVSKNIVHIVFDLGAHYAALRSVQYTSKDAHTWNNYLQTQIKVQEDLQPLVTAVGNGAKWIWLDAKGPEMMERAVAIFAPYKLVTKIAALLNLNRYGTTIKPPLFPHAGGLKEPRFAPSYKINQLRSSEAEDVFRYLISPKGELIIFDDDFALPYVLAAGQVEFSSGTVATIFREDKPVYFSRGMHLPDLVEDTFVRNGFPEAKARWHETSNTFTAEELIAVPDPIHPYTWNNPYLLSTYLATLQMNIRTNSDGLSDSRPWSYPLRDYANGFGRGLWNVVYEPLSLLGDGIVATVHSIIPAIINEDSFEKAKSHWRNSFFTKIGEFTLDTIEQYALIDMMDCRFKGDPFYQEYMTIQARQNARFDAFRASLNYLLFSAPGPVFAEAATEFVLPSTAIKAILMLRNYNRFGTFSHPPLFSPLVPRSEFPQTDFITGSKKIEDYLVTIQKIREEKMDLNGMFVITKQGKLIIGDDVTEHPIIANFQEVILAGNIDFEFGQVSLYTAGSGNYRPWGKNLERIGNHILKKEGFLEAPGKYKSWFGIRPSENPQIQIRQWILPYSESL